MPSIDALAFPAATKTYVKTVLDPIMMDMMQAVLEELPDHPLEFVMGWLRKRGNIREKKFKSLKDENNDLKRTVDRARLSAAEIIDAVQDDIKAQQQSESEEEESDEDDDAAVEAAQAEAMKVKAAQRGQRQSVSAEAYGAWNVKAIFQAPHYPKSDEQQARLRKTLNASFIFSVIPEKDLDIIIGAMQEKIFAPGDRIITEGEDGFDLFVIEEGCPECKKLVDGVQKVVKTCAPGDVFGELALLYNCPRAATVETAERCVCWRLDRETFNNVVREAAVKRSGQYDKFLQDVPLFKAMDPHERMSMVDALRCDSYPKDAHVVVQGESGDRFYIVEEGTLVAMKTTPQNDKPRNVNEYSTGMYFGEVALLKNRPRAASIVVTSETAKVVSIDRRCFMNIVGSVADILNRRMASYDL